MDRPNFHPKFSGVDRVECKVHKSSDRVPPVLPTLNTWQRNLIYVRVFLVHEFQRINTETKRRKSAGSFSKSTLSTSRPRMRVVTCDVHLVVPRPTHTGPRRLLCRSNDTTLTTGGSVSETPCHPGPECFGYTCHPRKAPTIRRDRLTTLHDGVNRRRTVRIPLVSGCVLVRS